MAEKGPTQQQGLLSCTYAEAVWKLHPGFEKEFRDDQVVIAKTMGKVYEKDWMMVLKHLKEGFP